MSGRARLLGGGGALLVGVSLLFVLGIWREERRSTNDVKELTQGGAASNAPVEQKGPQAPLRAASQQGGAEVKSALPHVALMDTAPEPSLEVQLAKALFSPTVEFQRGSDAERKAAKAYSAELMKRVMNARFEVRAAKFGGYASWESAQAELARLKLEDIASHRILSAILDDAIALVGLIDETALLAMQDPVMMEEWHADQSHDSTAWLSERYLPRDSHVSFSLSNGARDWSFCLHYNSIYFPEVEALALTLGERRRDLKARLNR